MRAFPLLLPSLASALAGPVLASSVPEPATVFYGCVINRNDGQPAVQAGELVWTLSAAGQTPLVLRAQLAPHDDGRFSYFIEVPHSALAPGLTATARTVALTTQPVAWQLSGITVDNHPAAIAQPGTGRIDLAAAARASTYRLDLSVSLPVPDSDGDGLPDWWEDANGLDHDLNDALLDPDGDGRNNLAEYLGGTGPQTDNRGPELLTSRMTAYAGATSGIVLRTADLDTPPAMLKYTLTSLPETGSIRLRTETGGEALGAGSQFTQADIEAGRITLEHAAGASTGPTRFSVSVRDEDAAHAPSAGEVEVFFFQTDSAAMPAQWLTAALTGNPLEGLPPEEQRPMRDAVLGREHAYVIWDQADLQQGLKLTQPADAQPNAISGGRGNDVLTGGPLNDFLAGGAGHDKLTGGTGADRFVVLGTGEGQDRITDFNPGEGDVLDLTQAFSGTSSRLTDYVRFRTVAGGSELAIDSNGDGSGFTDTVITLENFTAGQDPLYAMTSGGSLVTGTKTLPALVRMAASDASANEFGPDAGSFTLTRLGSLAAELTVTLQFSGSAINGVDYSFLPSTATFPAGASSVVVSVVPLTDSQVEESEVVELRLVEMPGYLTGTAGSSQVVITNLKPHLKLETLAGVATVTGERRGAIAVNRAGSLETGLLLRFQVSGTAAAGVDYNTVPLFLSLPSWQTSAVIEITPRLTAQISGGAETVVVSLVADPTYGLLNPSSATVVIVPEAMDLPTWRSRHFAGNADTVESFSTSDPGGQGVPALLRYGFGLDPSNPGANRSHLPAVSVVDGHLTLRYHEEMAATDLAYTVESSPDLRVWQPAGTDSLERLPLDSVSPQLRQYRSVRPVSDAAFQFLRVRVGRR